MVVVPTKIPFPTSDELDSFPYSFSQRNDNRLFIHPKELCLQYQVMRCAKERASSSPQPSTPDCTFKFPEYFPLFSSRPMCLGFRYFRRCEKSSFSQFFCNNCVRDIFAHAIIVWVVLRRRWNHYNLESLQLKSLRSNEILISKNNKLIVTYHNRSWKSFLIEYSNPA